MKTRFFAWLIFVFFTAFCLLSAQLHITQQLLAQKTVRLHVVANSDTPEDQAQKLRVRDAVLLYVSDLTAGCKNAQEARQLLSENLAHVNAAAEAVLAREGSAYCVRTTLCVEPFDTRVYDTFSLPAGNYPSLRVKIGAAEGKNWWCVVFPSLCMAASTQELETCAQLGGLTEEEMTLICGGEEDYQLRFQAWEWLQELLGWLS